MKHYGHIVMWDSLRFYGIIGGPEGPGCAARYFFHGSNVTAGEIKLWDPVWFDVSPTLKPGKLPEAINIIVEPLQDV